MRLGRRYLRGVVEVVLKEHRNGNRTVSRLKTPAVRLYSEKLLAVDGDDTTELASYGDDGVWYTPENVAVQPEIRPLGTELNLVIGDHDPQPTDVSTDGYCFFVFRDEKEMVYLQRNDGRENVFMLAPPVLHSDPRTWVDMETQVRCTRLTIASPAYFSPELATVLPGVRSRVSGLAERALAFA